MGWKRSDYVVSTKIFWGGSGPNDKGLSRKHVIEGTKVLFSPPYCCITTLNLHIWGPLMSQNPSACYSACLYLLRLLWVLRHGLFPSCCVVMNAPVCVCLLSYTTNMMWCNSMADAAGCPEAIPARICGSGVLSPTGCVHTHRGDCACHELCDRAGVGLLLGHF